MRGDLAIQVVTLFYMLRCTSTNTCTSYEAHIKDTSLQDKALSGFSFKIISGVTFGECSRHCGLTCRCRSFNMEINGGSGLCELNDVDKDEAPYALRVKKGFIHVSFRPLKNVSNLFYHAFLVNKLF